MTNESRLTGEQTEVTVSAVPLCTRCGKNPRGAGSDTNPWCNECRAAYKAEYDARRLDRKERHGFVLGVEAMRDLLCEEFNKLGFSGFAAYEVRDLIRGCAGPKLPE